MERRPSATTKGGVTRRDFIKGMGTGAIATAALPPRLGQAVPTRKGRVPVYDRKAIALTVNGQKMTLEVGANETLLDVLRGRLELTGSKKICDRGECGGCTVHLDGDPIYACMFLAIRADGRSIKTIEGLAPVDRLHPVQEAWIEKDGYQCGYCTPGFIMAVSAFLEKNPDPTRDEIRQALAGNLCRCGNYAKIITAVEDAARKMKGA